MIKIKVAEKNGVARELTFDKTTITIGRSAKNDLILPRNNVSKVHASIEVVKDKIVVKDLGSTNGTFINGRRINQPVTIEEKDSIYISDFVINASYEDEDIPEELSGIHEIIESSSDADLDGATLAGNINLQISSPGGVTFRTPSVPPVPVQSEKKAEAVAREPKFQTEVTRKKQKSQIRQESQKVSEPSSDTREISKKLSPSSTLYQICSRMFEEALQKLDLLNTEIHSIYSDEFKKKSSRVIAEILNTQLQSDLLPPDVEPRLISQILQREINGLGPLQTAIEDKKARSIVVLPDGRTILFMEDGSNKTLDEPFLSPNSIKFIVRKLLLLSSAAVQEGDPVVVGNMPNGCVVKIIGKPLSVNGTAISIQKRLSSANVDIVNLVERGILSKKMAMLLDYCIRVRAGILVADQHGISGHTLLPAITKLLPSWERVALIQYGSEELEGFRSDYYFRIAPESSETLTLSKSGESIFSLIPSLLPSSVVISGGVSPEILKFTRVLSASKTLVVLAVRECGSQGCIESLRQVVISDYPAMGSEEASRLAMEGFCLLVCYDRLMDGSEKVTSISDIQISDEGKVITRPIFVYEMKECGSKGEIVGHFKATKIVPWFLEEKKQKGLNIDFSIFQ